MHHCCTVSINIFITLDVFQTLDKVGPETVLHLSPDSVHLTTFPSNEGASAYVSIDPVYLIIHYMFLVSVVLLLSCRK